ncbi:MAG: hypothetical protein AB8G18_19905 [Gammaproteobacteria bacterium]
MKPTLKSIAFALAMVLPGYAAHACPGFALDVQPAGETSYNPSDAGYLAMQFELTLLDGPADANCANSIIEISSRGPTPLLGLQYGAAIIRADADIATRSFAVFNETRLRLSPFVVQQLVRTGRVLLTYGQLRPGVFAPAGRYSNILDIAVNGQVVATIEPELVIEPSMRLLGDMTDGQGRADFGILESFDRASTDFVYQANTRIYVSATSENQGNMIHEEGSAVGRIQYFVRVNNLPVSTDGNQTIPLISQIGVRSIGSVQMETGEIGNPVAGHYSDTLTLHFVAE